MMTRFPLRLPRHALPPLVLLILLMTSCDIQSGDDTVRNVSVRVAGNYVNESGLSVRQSGARTTRLSLTQSGNQLFAVDEHNIRWKGSISRTDGNIFAAFTLKGGTTAGGEVTLTGDIRIEGSTATMSGLWIEPGFTSSLSARAAVTPVPDPGPEPEPDPAPTNGGSTNGPSLVITSP